MFRIQTYIRLILSVFIPVTLLAQIQVSFQEGVNGYSGTVDTYIDNTHPASSYGGATALLWDSAPSEYTTFIRFDNIFTSQGGSIPDNSYIVSATLTYYVYDAGDDARVSEVALAWDESLTWNQIDFGNDIGTSIGYAESGTVNTYESVDVTNSLTSWSLNPSSNYGWIFQFTGSGGSDIYSSERSTVSQRPQLSVVYSDNFPPAQPTLISPADGSINIEHSPSLIITLTDPESDDMNVRYYARPVTSSGENFTLIGIPDTQYYTNNTSNNQYFYDQINWVVVNKDALNIVFISQLGDCVQNGDTYDSQWQVVNTAWSTVENSITTGLIDGIPYGLNIGNHDQSPIGGGSTASTAKFNEYFGVSRFQGRAYYGGHYGSDNDNHYELFSSGGMDFIVINLEYDTTPEQDVLDWADGLLKTHNTRRAIVVSHYLIETDNSGTPNAFGTQGQQIYDNLKDNANLFLMLCGHMHGEGRRTDVFEGNTIYTLLSDYQDYPNGGNGLLRIMEFRPVENKIYVSTYSPSLDQYESDSNSQFVLDYDMGAMSFQEVGYMADVVSGTNASFVWPSLSAETTYEWYVEVSDGNNMITGPTWSFTTDSDDVSLPVTLTNMSAIPLDKGILLEWQTESEINNLGFNIYRSEFEHGSCLKISGYQDNHDLEGLGNSSIGKEYRYMDESVKTDKEYWYKISDVDYSGNEIFHDPISVILEPVLLNDFQISQNYPNPFNPKTMINYELPSGGRTSSGQIRNHVNLSIYNLLGQRVATLVDEKQPAGSYKVEWDARDMVSGVYLYRIKVGNVFTDTKKLLLLK